MSKKRSFFEISTCWSIEAELDEIIQVFEEPLSLTRWWSPVFLRGELVSRGCDGRLGQTARFHTKGLLPYTFQFSACIDYIDTAGELQIRTWGDFDGRGDIKLERDGKHVLVKIRWRTVVHQPYIQGLIRLFKPAFVANHRWAMRRGREGLQAEILQRRGQASWVAPRRKPAFPHNFLSVRKRLRWTRDANTWVTR